MFTNSIEYYDRIYGEFKDYEAEAKSVDAFIRARVPDAKSVLDVACGTGEHARILGDDYGYRVDGVDIEEGFLSIAKKKCPSGRFYLADMREFELEKKYDVVMCLFSSIGYVKTIENTKKTIGNFARHLAPGGIMLVEPWISPDGFDGGHFHLQTVDAEDLKVARLSYSEVIGKISRIKFEYLIGSDGKILHESEVHELGLLSTEELSECFRAENLEFEYDESGLINRGLFVAFAKR